MKILKIVLAVLIILVGAFVIIGLFLPDDAHVERSIVVNAPQCTIFPLVNGFHRFNEWSPWHGIDPDTQYTWEGPDMGVGAVMTWTSEHKNVGSGSQRITASQPCAEVRTHHDFGDQGQAEGFFALQPEGEATRVMWGFDTSFEGSIIGRYFGLAMDSMVGADFERGLASLKEIAEKLPATDLAGLDIEIVEMEASPLVYTELTTSQDPEEIGKALGTAFARVVRFLQQKGLADQGPPLTITTSWEEDGWVCDVGMRVTTAEGVEVAEDSAVQIGQTHGGRAVKAVHVGPYETMPDTIEKMHVWIEAYGLNVGGRLMEEYISDPGETPEEELITHLCLPIT
jgi:effector-binding domain-containing protein